MRLLKNLFQIDKRAEGAPVAGRGPHDVRAETRKRITAGSLKRSGAPPEQVRLFKTLFPKGVSVTLEQAFVAVLLGQDLEWFLDGFLSPAEQADFSAIRQGAQVEYTVAGRKAWAAKQRVEWLALGGIVRGEQGES